MNFSEASDVTIVITSCNRFDLLQKTIESLDDFAQYPIKKVIIIEDSGSKAVCEVVPESWRVHTEVIINTDKLGQLASIDKAYESVDTNFIFHCEDDWEFYRPGFIGESREILLDRKEIVLVRLRSFYYDIKQRYPFHYLGQRGKEKGIAFYQLKSTDPDWQGFSFNPGLLRKSDYLRVAPYGRFESSSRGESQVSNEFNDLGLNVVVLENDACAHIGFGSHVLVESEKKVAARKKKIRQYRYVFLFLIGLVIGYYLSVL